MGGVGRAARLGAQAGRWTWAGPGRLAMHWNTALQLNLQQKLKSALTRVDVANGVVPRVTHPAASEDRGQALCAHRTPVAAEVNGDLRGRAEVAAVKWRVAATSVRRSALEQRCAGAEALRMAAAGAACVRHSGGATLHCPSARSCSAAATAAAAATTAAARPAKHRGSPPQEATTAYLHRVCHYLCLPAALAMVQDVHLHSRKHGKDGTRKHKARAACLSLKKIGCLAGGPQPRLQRQQKHAGGVPSVPCHSPAKVA